MNVIRNSASIVALLALAGSALAQAPGTIVFTDLSGSGSTGQAIRSWAPGNTVSTHVLFPVSANDAGFNDPQLVDLRLSDIRAGANGLWYFGSGPAQVANPNSNASIGQVYDLFGTPVVGTLTSNVPAINPLGMWYDHSRGSLLYINGTNQTARGGTAFPATDGGLNAVAPGSGATTRLWNQTPNATPTPFPNLGIFLTPSGQGNNDYYSTFANGGTYLTSQSVPVAGGGTQLQPANRNWSSIIARTSIPSITTGAATQTIIADFNGVNTYTDVNGQTQTLPLLTDVRGIIARPGSNELYITNMARNRIVGGNLSDGAQGIWKVLLDATGSSVVGVSQIYSSIAFDPEVIRFDPFTNTLVFSELGYEADLARLSPFSTYAGTAAGHNNGRLSRINLDGTGYTVLAQGVRVRGIDIIPTPGAMAVLGLGMVVAGRRRRA